MAATISRCFEQHPASFPPACSSVVPTTEYIAAARSSVGVENLVSIVSMQATDIFRLLHQRLNTSVDDKELRMTFISPHRGSPVPAVVESRLPAPPARRVIASARTPWRDVFLLLGIFNPRPPELVPIVRSARPQEIRGKRR
jgi:hypothetical protein